MVPTLLHEGQQRRHRYKEQTFKPRVNILFVNCLNPKCGHSAAWPFTCFLSFNLLFFFKRCQSYMKPQNLTNDSEFLFMELQMIQTFSLCSLSCSCPHTWSPCWGIYSSFWLSRLTPISTLPCTSSILGWHRFHLHHNLENDSGHSDSQKGHLLCRMPDTDVLFYAFWVFGWSPPDHDGLWPVHSHLSPSALLGHYDPRLCGSLVLVSLFICLLISQMHNSMVIKLTMIKLHKCGKTSKMWK